MNSQYEILLAYAISPGPPRYDATFYPNGEGANTLGT
jgi:hypothetical protein